jgi:hypothetical protein
MREIMVIAMRMDSMKVLCEIPFKDKAVTELDVLRNLVLCQQEPAR